MKNFFVYDPGFGGMMLFETEQERDVSADESVKHYLEDDEWDEAVTHIRVGVITHAPQQVDYKKRPLDCDIDDEGFDDEGLSWNGDYEYVCNYAILPVNDGSG